MYWISFGQSLFQKVQLFIWVICMIHFSDSYNLDYRRRIIERRKQLENCLKTE